MTNKLKFMKYKNTAYLLFLLCFPSLGLTQMLDDVIDELKSIKSKNYNFYLDSKHSEKYDIYTLKTKELNKDIYGKVQTVNFKNLKGNKTLVTEDQQKILKSVNSILEKYNYSPFSSSPKENAYVFQKVESDTITNYLQLYIPQNSNEFCNITYIEVAREINYLNDRSFEDYRNNMAEDRWQDCAKLFFEGNSPPGLHFSNYYDYGFSHQAAEGKKYISLIAREDKTWELLGQKLNYVLRKDSCYKFSVDLRNENKFKAPTRSKKKEVKFYDKELVLTVSLATNLCYPDQVIYKSEKVTNSEWETYEIQFTPNKDFNFIIFEANYADGKAGNGNIMMDNISDIKSTSCKN